MKLALFGNSYSKLQLPYIQALVNKLEKSSVSFIVHHNYYDMIEKDVQFKSMPDTFDTGVDLKKNADMLLAIGGDGTMLSTIQYVKDTGVPVVGFNTGRLGFLSHLSKEEVDASIDAIINENYIIEHRSLINVNTLGNLFGKNNIALNECTIHKRDSAAMITIHAFLNDEFLNSYWADGLIISTPTGSTAYSLSCGGPIVAPDCANFVITPIAPHNLNVRPLIIPDNKTLRLKIEGRQKSFLVTLDSRSDTIANDYELVITKDKRTFNLVKLNTQSYFNTLRNKLFWGIDKRN